MKYFLLLTGLLLSGFIGFSQVAINTDGSLPNPNAILDLKSGTLGLLLPRTDSLSRMAIPNIGGMIIYDSTTGSPWYNSGLTWVNLGSTGSGGGGWSLTGNAGTVDGTNFLGTTDNTPLTFRVNNQQSGRIDQKNTFFGYQSGISYTYASNGNTGYGFQSLYSNNGGSDNVGVGFQSLYSNTYGGLNVAVGYGSLYSNTQGEENVAVGYGSMQFNITGSNNTALGYFSLNNNTSGAGNIAIGNFALGSNTTGYGNVAMGNSAFIDNTTGSNNVAVGISALGYNSSGSSNVAIGSYTSVYNGAAVGNVAIGDSALLNNTVSYNTAVGYYALGANTSGDFNTAVGSGSLQANTTATANTAVGNGALAANTTGVGNTATGAQALGSNITGTANSAFGAGALQYTNTTGQRLTAIGNGAGVSVDGLSDATAIGAFAVVGSSHTIQLGDALVTAVNSAGTFNTISDGRFKFNIQEDVRGLDFIMKLRPVTYQLDTRKIRNSQLSGSSLVAFTANHNSDDLRSMRIRRTGFIAQEVEKAADSTGFDFDAVKKPENDRDHYSLSYEEFVVPLVKAVQEQQEQIEDLKKQIEDLKKMVTALSKK
jgi:trimeric autotransporter adhesin